MLKGPPKCLFGGLTIKRERHFLLEGGGEGLLSLKTDLSGRRYKKRGYKQESVCIPPEREC